MDFFTVPTLTGRVLFVLVLLSHQLVVRPDRTATLTCEDGNYNVVFMKEIRFTDFPLNEFTLWFANDTICLPAEHIRQPRHELSSRTKAC
jgi:hypothetical protein